MQDISENVSSAPLTPAEQAMAHAIAGGETAVVGDEPVRASVIRDLVFGHGGLRHDPVFGIRIDGAIIEGTVDLDGASIAVPVVLSNCKIVNCEPEAALSLRDAEVRRLALVDVTLETAVVADRAIIASGLIAERVAAPAPLHLTNARIGHTLSLSEAMLGNGTQALIADGLQLDGTLNISRATLTGSVALTGADIRGSIQAGHAAVGPSKAIGAALKSTCSGLDLKGATIHRDICLSHAAISGTLGLRGVRVGGHLEADGVTVTAVGSGVDMTDFDSGHSVGFDDARIAGKLRLSGATIAKHFVGRRLRVDGGEMAIDAARLRVGGDLDLAAARLVGQVRCASARIQGRMQFNEVKVYGSELAVNGDGIRVGGEASFSQAFFVGSVRMPEAEFAGTFSLGGATIKVANGAALVAADTVFAGRVGLGAGLQTIGGVVLDRARVGGVCSFAGSRLRSAAIARAAGGSQHSLPAGHDKRLDEAVISLVDASLDYLQMPAQINERPRGVVDLSRATVGSYEDWLEAWPPPPAERTKDMAGRDLEHLVLDGFRYDRLLNPAGTAERAPAHLDERAGVRRLAWFGGQSEDDGSGRFQRQPWVQLETCLAAQGLKRDARRITIERRRRQRLCPAMTAPARWANRLQDSVTLYGFSPWRIIVLMIAIVVGFGAVWALAASHCTREDCTDQTVFVMTSTDGYTAANREAHYPPFNAMAYALDNFLPFGSIGYADHWRPNAHYVQLTEITLPHIPVFLSGETGRERIYTRVVITVGGLLYLLTLTEQLLGLICLSLLVSHFAGLLRNEK